MLRLVSEMMRTPGSGDHQQYAHQNTGNPARHEKASDGHFTNRSEDNQAHAGRDRRNNQAGKSVDGGSPAAGITQSQHFRSENAGFHCRIGSGRTGYPAHQGAQQAGNLSHVPPHMPGAGIAEAGQAFGDTAGIHQVAGENKERNRQHGKAL